MDVAILKADITYDVIRENVCDISVLYQDLFESHNITFFNVREGVYPSRYYDLYVITGSAASAYDDIPWVKKLRAFVKEHQTQNILGICFGHQIVAEALGGKVEKSDYGWNLGLKELTIQHKKNWMTPFDSDINMIFNHRDQVVSLPEGANILAGNNIVRFQMYTIGSNILCVQGHPEFTSTYQTTLMDYIRNVIDDDNLIATAKKSYHFTHKRKLIFKWIHNFFMK